MVIVDAHTHAVSPDLERHPRRPAQWPVPWLSERPHDATALVAALRSGEVDRAVLVQAQGAYGFDNSYVMEAAALHPDVLTPVVSIDMTSPTRADALAALVEAGAGGVRLFSVPTPTTPWLTDPATFDVWELARHRDLVVSICALPAELDAMAEVAGAFGGVAVVVDHGGFVPLPDAGRLDDLASLDNVTLKITGHVLHKLHEAGAEVDVIVAGLAARFGAERLMWGSDFPQTALSYQQSRALAELSVGRLRPAERDAILGGTARRLYRL